jgi:hypothetical protein
MVAVQMWSSQPDGGPQRGRRIKSKPGIIHMLSKKKENPERSDEIQIKRSKEKVVGRREEVVVVVVARQLFVSGFCLLSPLNQG